MGFKKIEPIVIREYGYQYGKIDGKYVDGLYIQNLSDFNKEPDSFGKNFTYPKINSQYVSKIQSYFLRVTEVLSIYLIIVGGEFTLVIKDSSVESEEKWGTKYLNDIKVPISSESLNENFWKICLQKVGKEVQRELLLREIFKYG